MSSTLKLTVQQYDAMVAKGAFEDLERKVELVHGEIRTMNPSGPIHDGLIEYLTHWSVFNTDHDEIRVRVQSGLSLPELDSRPEPDIAWVQASHPRERHPIAREVLLLIEVSDASLDMDRTVKASLYARAGIPEYWVVNSPEQVVHVYRDPGSSGYATMKTIRTGESVVPLSAPNSRLELNALFAIE